MFTLHHSIRLSLPIHPALLRFNRKPADYASSDYYYSALRTMLHTSSGAIKRADESDRSCRSLFFFFAKRSHLPLLHELKTVHFPAAQVGRVLVLWSRRATMKRMASGTNMYTSSPRKDSNPAVWDEAKNKARSNKGG